MIKNPQDIDIHDFSVFDDAAWHAITNWHESFADQKFIYRGFDFGLLLRYPLARKIGRAFRRKYAPADEVLFEMSDFFDPKETKIEKINSRPLSLKANFLYKFKRRLHAIKKTQKTIYRSGVKNCILIPELHDRLNTLVNTILDELNIPIVTTKQLSKIEHGKIFAAKLPEYLLSEEDLFFATSLFSAVNTSFAKLNIVLELDDYRKLYNDIINIIKDIYSVEKIINRYPPKIIILYKDTHSPHQLYALKAKTRGIPVLLMQHGLDCEKNYLDDVYSSHIAVWGEYRRKRYYKESFLKPNEIRITGNPEYDKYSLKPFKYQSAKRWLWVTRPHRSVNCYSPSRFVSEGVEICKALLNILKQYPNSKLIIKPHPYDYVMKYQSIIAEAGLNNRAEITYSSLETLFDDVDFVLTEDTTAGLEAMIFGKALIHVNFSAMGPILPMTKFDAALPGFTADQLRKMIHKMHNLSKQEIDKMKAGQLAFIKYSAGNLDGRATRRVAEFVQTLLTA